MNKERVICAGCETCSIKNTCSRLHGKARLIESICKYGGTVLFFLGSLLFATTHWAGNTPVTFLMFLIGHTAWAIAGLLMKEDAVAFLNLMYVIFDAAAVYIRM